MANAKACQLDTADQDGASGSGEASCSPPEEGLAPAQGLAGSFAFMVHTAALWESREGDKLQAATALVRYLSNVLDHPSALQYRRIKSTGAAFSRRVGCCPGAIEVLKRSGFSEMALGHAGYWVMRDVDEALLRAIATELNVGIATAQRLQRARAANQAVSSTQRSANPAGSSPLPCDEAFVDATTEPPRHREVATAPMPAEAGSSYQRQLKARSAVLRVHATAQASASRSAGTMRAAVTAGALCLAAWLTAAFLAVWRD